MGCREDRLELMMDLLIEQTDQYTFVECVDGIHKGCFIAWLPNGKCFAVGKREWVERKLSELRKDNANV